jgi:hypothetical protein
MSTFELTYSFHRFSLQDYKQWRSERLKDPSPLKAHEPVAYFEFDSDNHVTVEPDFRRLCKYIFLKPTGFRKKPTAFTQKVSVAPLEIEFFGVTGSTVDPADLHSGQREAPQSAFSLDSHWGVQLSLLAEQDKVLKTIKSVPI